MIVLYVYSNSTMNIVGVSFIILLLSVVLCVYTSRDRLVERLENSKGEKGDKGERGIPGPSGRQGERGVKGDAGGTYHMIGPLGNIGCLEGNDGKRECYGTVNKLSGDIVLGNKDYSLENIWVYQSDGTIRNKGNGKCLNVVKNTGVGADTVKLAICSGETGNGTQWIYDSANRLIPKGGSDGWALSIDDGKLAMKSTSATDVKQKWTFFG